MRVMTELGRSSSAHARRKLFDRQMKKASRSLARLPPGESAGPHEPAHADGVNHDPSAGFHRQEVRHQSSGDACAITGGISMADSTAYLSAVAALVGTFVGGVTSIATSWLGQQRQTREQRRAREKDELQALYKQFIIDGSNLFADALEHDATEIPKLVDIYATLNRIRVLSSPQVIAEADKALRMIIDTYAKENATFSGIRQSIDHGFPDPLRAFSEACHEDLKTY
jgi:hypothetical protein